MDHREYRIGEAAVASGLSVKTIRYYETIGLIPKAPRHNNGAHTGGNRLFSHDDIGRLRFIRQARELGLGLAEVSELVAIAEHSCPSRHSAYRKILNAQLAKVDRKVAELTALRERLVRMLRSNPSGAGENCSQSACDCLAAAPND